MDDLISRTRTLKVLEAMANLAGRQDGKLFFGKLYAQIKDMPTIDAKPVVHGRWIKMTGMLPPEYHGHYECSECQWHMKGIRNSWTREEELPYCPNCGAKMDGEWREADGE